MLTDTHTKGDAVGKEPAIVRDDGCISTPAGESYCRNSVLPFTQCRCPLHIVLEAGRDEILEALREARAALAEANRRADGLLANNKKARAIVAEEFNARWNSKRKVADLVRKLETAKASLSRIETIDCNCAECHSYTQQVAREALAAIDAQAPADPTRDCEDYCLLPDGHEGACDVLSRDETPEEK